MKKFAFFLGLALSVVAFSSCKKSCINCSGVTICQDTYEASMSSGDPSWSEYKAAALQSGCTEE